MQTTEIKPQGVTSDGRDPVRQTERRRERRAFVGLPATRSLRLAYVLSLVTALLMAGLSAVGLVLGPGGIYGDPGGALTVIAAAAGVLVPGFMAHDALNLAVGMPILLGSVWLAHRGSLMGFLLWTGALFYVLYTYVTYLVGAPFGLLFIPHVALVVISAYTALLLVASVNRDEVRRQFAGGVPARAIGVVLIALALLTLGQDGLGAVTTALADTPASPIARHVWTADLLLEVPALLISGVLLWRRAALGYLAAPGLLFQFGITPVVLAAILVLQPTLPGSPIEGGTIIGLLVFAVIAFAPIGFFARATRLEEATK